MAFKKFNFDDVAYFGNCVGPIIKTINIESIEAQSLIVNDNFIDLVLCIYVDYNNLNGYYGNCLKLIENQRSAVQPLANPELLCPFVDVIVTSEFNFSAIAVHSRDRPLEDTTNGHHLAG